MRTDGVQLSSQAIEEVRSEIINRHDKSYVPEIPRVYKSKAANAQEAHEAIRPTDIQRDPESISNYLDSCLLYTSPSPRDTFELIEIMLKRKKANIFLRKEEEYLLLS